MGAADDEYAKQYMGATGALAASRMRMGPLLFVLMGLAMLGTVAATIGTGQLFFLPLLFMHAFFLLTMSHLRVTVTREIVHIQYGLFGPKIAVSSIVDARAVPYDWKKYGGWGMRYGKGGAIAYSVTGGRKMGIELDVRDKNGKVTTIFASSDEPEELVRGIEKATGKTFASTGVRVAAEVDAEAISEGEGVEVAAASAEKKLSA